jgi:hypothetical protein
MTHAYRRLHDVAVGILLGELITFAALAIGAHLA